MSRNADSHYLVDNYFKDTLRAAPSKMKRAPKMLRRLPFFPDSLAALVFSRDSPLTEAICISWSMS